MSLASEAIAQANRLPTINPTSTSPRKCFPTKMRLMPTISAHIRMEYLYVPWVVVLILLAFLKPMVEHTAKPMAFAAWAE